MREKCRITALIEAGIIDHVKVVRTTISNAASIAGLLLTTEADRHPVFGDAR